MDLSHHKEQLEQIRMALLKTPASRSYDDLLLLKSYITKTELITKDLAGVVSPRQMNDICRSLGMETYQSGENVFNQGDVGDKVYIVLEGSCEVKVRYKIDLLQGESEIREKHIVTYSSGQFFGERALQFDEPRSATVTCLELSHFVTIQKNMYLSVLAEARREVSHNLKAEQFGTKEGVIKILSKIREKRTTQELDAVASYLYRRIPFFQKFTMQQLIELCRVAETVTIWGRSILFKQGQIGQAFYVILTGTVEVWVNDSNHHSLLTHGRAGKSNDLTDGLGAKVNQLVTGDVFGERALENDSSQRMASIITGEDTTELLVIAKEDYHNLVYVMMHSDSMHKLQLLRRTDIFHSLDVVHLRALARFMEPKKFQIDEEIVSAGKRAFEMIIIETGECRVITEVNEGLEHLTPEEIRKLKDHHYMHNTHAHGDSNTATTTSVSITHHRTIDSARDKEKDQFSTEHNHKLHQSNKKATAAKHNHTKSKEVLNTSAKEMKKNLLHTSQRINANALNSNTTNEDSDDDKPNSPPPPTLSILRNKLTKFNSCELIPVAKKKRVDLGRIAPNSVIAPYIATCESIHVEVFHPETIVASSLVNAYTIGKHDFFNHMPKDSRAALVKIVKDFKAPVLNPLWENTPKVLDDQQYKMEKAWEKFRSDLSHNPSKEVNILETLKQISRYHISANSGNDPTLKMKKIDISGFQKDAGKQTVEVTMDWGKTSQSDAIALAAKEAVDKRSPTYSSSLAKSTSVKDLIKSASMTNLIRTRLNQAHVSDMSYSLMNTNSGQKDNEFVMGSRPLGSTLLPEDMQDKHQQKLTEYPFILVQIHREYSRANPVGAVDPSRRLLKSYVRICGSFPSCAKAKEMADTQMEQLFLTMFQSKPEHEDELILQWNTFKSYPSMPVNDSDHFLIYCRSTPMEYASINPSKNIFHVAYPSICKVQNQRYAVVMVNPITSNEENMFATKKKDTKMTSKFGKSVSMGNSNDGEDEAYDVYNGNDANTDEEEEEAAKGKQNKRKGKAGVGNTAGVGGGVKKALSNINVNAPLGSPTSTATTPLPKLRRGSTFGSLDIGPSALDNAVNGPNSNVDLGSTFGSVGGVKVNPWPLYLQELAVVFESIVISSTRLESLRYAIRRFGSMPNQSLLQHSPSTTTFNNTITSTKTGEQIIEYHKSASDTTLLTSPVDATTMRLKPIQEQNKNDRMLKLAHFENKKICVIPLFKWVLINEDTLDTLNFLYAFKESNIRKILLAEEFDLHRMEVEGGEMMFSGINESIDKNALVPARRVGEYRDVMTSLEERQLSSELIKSFSEAGFIPHDPMDKMKTTLAAKSTANLSNTTTSTNGIKFIDQPETNAEVEAMLDQARALQILEKEMESKEISKQIHDMQSQFLSSSTQPNTLYSDHHIYLHNSKNTFSSMDLNNGMSNDQNFSSTYGSTSSSSRPNSGSINLEQRLQALNAVVTETSKLLDTSNQLCTLEHVTTPPKPKAGSGNIVNPSQAWIIDDDDESSSTVEESKKKGKSSASPHPSKSHQGKITNDRLRNLHKDDKMGIMKERLHVIESLQKVHVNSSNPGSINVSMSTSTLRPNTMSPSNNNNGNSTTGMNNSTSAASFFGLGPKTTSAGSNQSSNSQNTPAGRKLAENLRILSESLDAQLLKSTATSST